MATLNGAPPAPDGPVFVPFLDSRFRSAALPRPDSGSTSTSLILLAVCTNRVLFANYEAIWARNIPSDDIGIFHTLVQNSTLFFATRHIQLDAFVQHRLNLYRHVPDIAHTYEDTLPRVAALFGVPVYKPTATTPALIKHIETYVQATKHAPTEVGALLDHVLEQHAGEAVTRELLTHIGGAFSPSARHLADFQLQVGWVMSYLEDFGGAIPWGFAGGTYADPLFPYDPTIDLGLLRIVAELTSVVPKRLSNTTMRALAESRDTSARAHFATAVSNFLSRAAGSVTRGFGDIRPEIARRTIAAFLPRALSVPSVKKRGPLAQRLEAATTSIIAATESLDRLTDPQHGGLKRSHMDRNFDFGILGIIGAETQALCKAFSEHSAPVDFVEHGSLFWKVTVRSRIAERALVGVIYGIGKAGNSECAAAASLVIQSFQLPFICLTGIAAGMQQHCIIGDVIVPRLIVDQTLREFRSGRFEPRTVAPEIPHATSQMLGARQVDWHGVLKRAHRVIGGAEHTETPRTALGPQRLRDPAIVSQDVLIRDPSILKKAVDEVHNRAYIGDMEAAGFARAAHHRFPPTPWIIVRSVSDYGDPEKGDSDHPLAAAMAASYTFSFFKEIFDPRLVGVSANA